MTAKEIQDIVGKNMVMRGHSPVCSNLTYLTTKCGKMCEADVLSVTGAGYVCEFEVKISKADFKKDGEKIRKHNQYNTNPRYLANYFYYVCPEGLIKSHEIQNYAGLIYVVNGALKTIVSARLLHKDKHNLLKLMTKICRVQAERLYLGACKLTYLNNNIKSRNKTILENAGFTPEMMKAYKIK